MRQLRATRRPGPPKSAANSSKNDGLSSTFGRHCGARRGYFCRTIDKTSTMPRRLNNVLAQQRQNDVDNPRK